MSKLEPTIFLSHSHADRPFVTKIANHLTKTGVKVWLDEAEINVGDSHIQKIGEAINQTDYVAVFLSQNSVKSDWVNKELHLAMNKEINGKRVVVLPLLIEPCELPLFIKDKVYADFTALDQYTSEFRKLLRSIGVNIEPEQQDLMSIFELPDRVGYILTIRLKIERKIKYLALTHFGGFAGVSMAPYSVFLNTLSNRGIINQALQQMIYDLFITSEMWLNWFDKIPDSAFEEFSTHAKTVIENLQKIPIGSFDYNEKDLL